MLCQRRSDQSEKWTRLKLLTECMLKSDFFSPVLSPAPKFLSKSTWNLTGSRKTKKRLFTAFWWFQKTPFRLIFFSRNIHLESVVRIIRSTILWELESYKYSPCMRETIPVAKSYTFSKKLLCKCIQKKILSWLQNIWKSCNIGWKIHNCLEIFFLIYKDFGLEGQGILKVDCVPRTWLPLTDSNVERICVMKISFLRTAQ